MCKFLHDGIEERYAPFTADLRVFCNNFDEVDAVAEYAAAESVEIGGLNQKTFDYFVENYGGHFKNIYFFKCPKVSNLSALSTLENVEFLKFYWNNSAETLWDMQNNANLKRVELIEFTKLSNFNGVQNAQKLKYLSASAYSGRVVNLSALEKSRVAVLDIIARIPENSAEIFLKMKNLQALFIHPHILETETLAFLAANLKVRSETLYPYVKMRYADAPDIIICGKRKPSLYSAKSAKKIDEYKRKFYALVKKYEGMTYCEAFPDREELI